MTTTIQDLAAELVTSGIPKVDISDDGENLFCRAFELRNQGVDYWLVRGEEIIIHGHGPDGFFAIVYTDDDGEIIYTKIEHGDSEELPDCNSWVLTVPGWHGVKKTRELAGALLALAISALQREEDS